MKRATDSRHSSRTSARLAGLPARSSSRFVIVPLKGVEIFCLVEPGPAAAGFLLHFPGVDRYGQGRVVARSHDDAGLATGRDRPVIIEIEMVAIGGGHGDFGFRGSEGDELIPEGDGRLSCELLGAFGDGELEGCAAGGDDFEPVRVECFRDGLSVEFFRDFGDGGADSIDEFEVGNESGAQDRDDHEGAADQEVGGVLSKAKWIYRFLLLPALDVGWAGLSDIGKALGDP